MKATPLTEKLPTRVGPGLGAMIKVRSALPTPEGKLKLIQSEPDESAFHARFGSDVVIRTVKSLGNSADDGVGRSEFERMAGLRHGNRQTADVEGSLVRGEAGIREGEREEVGGTHIRAAREDADPGSGSGGRPKARG